MQVASRPLTSLSRLSFRRPIFATTIPSASDPITPTFPNPTLCLTTTLVSSVQVGCSPSPYIRPYECSRIVAVGIRPYTVYAEDEDRKFGNTVAPAFICLSLSPPLAPLSRPSFCRPISVATIPHASDPAPSECWARLSYECHRCLATTLVSSVKFWYASFSHGRWGSAARITFSRLSRNSYPKLKIASLPTQSFLHSSAHPQAFIGYLHPAGNVHVHLTSHEFYHDVSAVLNLFVCRH
ncbi:hypothetical protein B0H14DRAFT_3052830 [Mycena olivaceomarginata]|nr:hypothetical protein B0H14DRAFT_3052830 [Mycena olivaceomarginata]